MNACQVSTKSDQLHLGLNGFDVVDNDGRLYDAMMALAVGELSKGQMAALLEQVSESWRDDD
jgi:hypothetical protein